MRLTQMLRYGILLGLCLLLGLAQPGLSAPLPQERVWLVTYPSDGTNVSGEITITGTATHPNFSSYGLLYAPGPSPTASSQWIPVVFGVQTMVVNGPLATWDTTGVPNGQYTLALAVYEVGNDTPNLHFVNNITVQNDPPTPTPTPTPEPEETPPPDGPTPEGPPAGPTVVQPPTATPRPTGTPVPGQTPTASDEPDERDPLLEAFSTHAMREAVCSGAWIAVILYAIGGLYFAARAAFRYYLRQMRRR